MSWRRRRIDPSVKIEDTLAHWPSRSAVRVEVSVGMAVLSFCVRNNGICGREENPAQAEAALSQRAELSRFYTIPSCQKCDFSKRRFRARPVERPGQKGSLLP